MGFVINPLGPPFDVTGSGGGSGTPGGPDTSVQFNDGGSFGGDEGLIYNKTSQSLQLVAPAIDGNASPLVASATISPTTNGKSARSSSFDATSLGSNNISQLLAVYAQTTHLSSGTAGEVTSIGAFNDYEGGLITAGSSVRIYAPFLDGDETPPTAHYGLLIENQTLTGVTTNYAVDVNAKFRISADGSCRILPTGESDGAFTGTAIDGTAGATLTFGDLIYLAVADSRWELTDADSVTTCGSVITGMCVLAAAADGSATRILLNGRVRADAKFPALIVGAPVYASTTPGAIQVAAPSGTDDIVQVVGYAITADEIYFNPSSTYLTVA